jgi:hypothetical protein
MRMKPALVIFTIVVGIALVEATSMSTSDIPAAYAKKKDKQFCTHIRDFDEDGTPVIGKSCSDDMKTCKNDPEGIDKCVKDSEFS